MRKLLLHIGGKLVDVVRIDFVSNNILEQQLLLKNAVEKLKIKWRRDLEGADWEIYLSVESKLIENQN